MKVFFFYFFSLSRFSSPDQTEMGWWEWAPGRHWVPRPWYQCWWGRMIIIGSACPLPSAAVRPAALAGGHQGLDSDIDLRAFAGLADEACRIILTT